MTNASLYKLGLTPKLGDEDTIDISELDPRQRTNIRLYGPNCKDWTPLMISDYKRKWAPTGTPIVIFNYDSALKWCKKHLYHHTFNATKYANPDDSHSVHFKNAEEAMLFRLSITG